MRVLRSYRLSLVMIASIIAGAAAGQLAPGFAAAIKPVGDLFLNLIFMIIVPLVFFSVSSSIANSPGSTVSRISLCMLGVFLLTSVIAAVTSLLFLLVVTPSPGVGIVLKLAAPLEPPHPLAQLVKTVTVPTFAELLSHRAMLPLLIFSSAVGVATRRLGSEGEPLARILASGSRVALKLVDYVMLTAPAGLFAYFAATVAETGAQLAGAYLALFTAYYLFGTFYFLAGFSAYVWCAGGGVAVRRFWSQMLTPSLTALGTCSSMATIPANLEAAPAMGAPREVSDLVIPVGAVIHKDGSVIGGVVKVLFALSLFHLELTPQRLVMTIAVAVVVGVVIGAIPSGGMIGELFILSVFGFGQEALPLLVAISVLIDPLATLINATGDDVAAVMVTRLVKGSSGIPEKTPMSELRKE
ncbi:dicarboxylate/amino acid:cation symporter [Geomonas sp. RF6]|uniref:dicarboxylate/amino acid:cation symporter n=1 Tax=Geomonas sp. RF6 TaxID=2897342 RepID=UPI001E4EA7FC|nr:dicarboxylate/amino acid:cation symporter [Geomonas sp. RF6]UFS69583.1 dicarboxylate/amino acid:cation symporter [Geomonas sp. RF6]